MIQILRSTRNNAVGWRFGEEGQVFQGGQLRHDNGQWEIESEFDEASDALDILDEEDGDALIHAIEAAEAEDARLEAAKSERQSNNAAELEAFIKLLESDTQGRTLKWGAKRFKRDSFGRILYIFRKKGGYRDWLFPVGRDDLRGLLAGTHELRYQIGTNSARIVKK